ncbi:hypothetical protein GCM10029963_41350 [Micromonospora andamanensis]
MGETIIEAEGLGIRFVRNRRRQLRLRELFIHRGTRGASDGRFWPLRDVSFSIAPGRPSG